MNKRERVAECISNMSDSRLVSVWNEYCYANYYYDDVFVGMGMFDELHDGMKPLEIANLLWDEYFNPNHEFYREGYRIRSFAYASDCVNEMDLVSLVNHIVNNDDWLHDEDIRDALYDEDEEEDDE